MRVFPIPSQEHHLGQLALMGCRDMHVAHGLVDPLVAPPRKRQGFTAKKSPATISGRSTLNMPILGDFEISSQSTAYFIGFDSTACVLLMRFSLRFLSTSDARNAATSPAPI
jgi:hypothetical protein